MVFFLLFLELLGVGVFLTGLFSLFITKILPMYGVTETLIGVGITTSLLFLYIHLLNQFFLKLYREMRVEHKELQIKEIYLLRCSLLLLMSFHYYSLLWLETKVDNIIHYVVLVLLLSFFLGFAIKGIFDEAYQIKSTKETDKLITNR